MRSLPRCITVGCSEKSILLFSPYFTTLSVVVMLCIKKPINKGFLSAFALWNISVASVGTEELAHMEIISAIIYQLTRNLNVEDLQKGGFDAYYIDHTTGVYPVNASGVPFSASTFQSTGDAIADLHEDLAAEGTTAKERPVISTPEKALFYAGFRTFMLLKIAALDLIRTTNHKNMIGQAVSKKH